MKEILQSLEALMPSLSAQLPANLRPWSIKHDISNDRGIMVTGSRGVGKTTFLLTQAQRVGRHLYVSADHPRFADIRLWQFGEEVFSQGYDVLVIDEIHYATEWAKDVKALYDSFPSKKIWVSDSSSLILRQGTTDLSRRMPRLPMPLLSFREYISLRMQAPFPAFNVFLGEAPSQEWLAVPRLELRDLFRQYMREGARPIFAEGRYVERSLAIMEKMIFSDVTFFLDSVQKNHLSLMNAVIGHISSSPVPTVNIESLARQWSIGKPKIYELLSIMQELELLNIVKKKTDHGMGKGAKMLLADWSWYSVLNGNVGSQREAFFVGMLRGAAVPCFAATQETDCDFVTPWGLVEVEGANKHRKQAKYVVRDDIHVATPSGGIPMWMVGCLY